MCAQHLNIFKSSLKSVPVCETVKTELTNICHHTLECRRKAIMCIRKMQALTNEMPEQNSEDGSNGVFLPHVSAR